MRYFLLSGLCLLSAGVYASGTELDDVTITAQGDPSVSGSLYFSRADIEGRFFTLSDFLARVNGIQVQQLSGIGNPALLSIRGASGQHTRVVINGVEESSAQYGSYDINRIPLSQIESIEIVRDGVSRDHIDDAIGGTVYITTRQQSADSSINLQAGSYGTWSAAATTQLTDAVSVQAEHLQSDNNYLYEVPAPSDDSLVRDQDEKLNNAGFYRNSVQLNAVFSNLHGRIRLNRQKKEIPDYFRNNPENDASLESRTNEYELGGRHNNASGISHWQLNSRITHEAYTDTAGLIGLGEDDDRYRYDHNQLTLSQEKTFSAWVVKAQLDGSEQNYTSRYRNDADSSSCSTPEGNCDTYSYQREIHYALQAGWHNASHSLSSDMSLSRRSIGAFSRPQSTQEKDTYSDAFNGLSAAIHYKQDQFTWSAAFKRAGRVPSLYERYGDHGLFLSNEDIETEISNTYSAGLQVQLLQNTQLQATLFQRQLSNALVPVYDSRGIGRYENVSDAVLTGLEWQFSWCGDYIFTDLSGSHYDSEVNSDVASFDGNKIAGTYHTSLQWTAGISYQAQQLQISAEYDDDLYTDRSNLIAGDTRALLSASYRYTFASADAGIRISNLTNNRFLDYTNRPVTGREWLIYLTKNF